MTKTKFLGMALFSLLIALSANAQQLQLQDAPHVTPSISDKPVWALEFVKVKPGTFAATMSYLDDNWIRVRAEAKRQGAVLIYNRVADERRVLIPAEESSNNDWDILLMTEYQNQAAYDGREKLFASILQRLPDNTAGIIQRYKKEDLFQSVKIRVLQDFSENGYPQLRLLTRK
jgi:hypothetical protein